MSFQNVYQDRHRAEAYATLEFPGTYSLAFRDLPEMISRHVQGTRALDFGCGAGRSTRFLRGLGFDAVGIDVSAEMVELARGADPAGRYLLVGSGDFSAVDGGTYDLILAAYPFDNIPGVPHRKEVLCRLAALLAPNGRLVLLGSTPEIYVHEWTSFSTRDFPENREARSGEIVRIVMKDVPDQRPVEDLLWRHEDYLELFDAAGLRILEEARPLGRPEDPIEWVSETAVAPWVIYVLGRV